tara:strand:+ start:287 stop:460 length:174 start_codon:yes stop_codon:yes gene_type:complete
MLLNFYFLLKFKEPEYRLLNPELKGNLNIGLNPLAVGPDCFDVFLNPVIDPDTAPSL